MKKKKYVLNIIYKDKSHFSKMFDTFEEVTMMVSFYGIPSDDIIWWDINEVEVKK